MNATIRYNRVAHFINKQAGRTVVNTCQMPKDKYMGYFKDGVALEFKALDDAKWVMNTFGTIEINETPVIVEPWNYTYMAVWEV